jgi:hypothetical protein
VAVIRNNLGMALERTGHPVQARTQFERACDLGSARGEASLARLDAMVLPADEAPVDLPALAAAWATPGDETEVAAPADGTVAAVTFEEAEDEDDR